MLVIEHQLAEQLDLLDLIIRRCRQPLERLCLDPIDFGFHLCNFRKCRRRQRCAGFLRAHDIDAQRGNDDDRSEHQTSHEGGHPARPRQLTLIRVNWDRSLLALKLQSIDRSRNFAGVLTRPSTKDVGETRRPFRYAHSSLSLAVPTNSMHSAVLPSASKALARVKIASTPPLESTSARLTDSGVG